MSPLIGRAFLHTCTMQALNRCLLLKRTPSPASVEVRVPGGTLTPACRLSPPHTAGGTCLDGQGGCSRAHVVAEPDLVGAGHRRTWLTS